MPVTPFQKEVLLLLARHRAPDSHVAGGLALNSFFPEGRLSRDVDIFHDTASSVARSAAADVATLEQHGYRIEWAINDTNFKRAKILKNEQHVTIDWTHDSAFRYFPAEPDEMLGWRLHLADLATNKALALSARSKTRDLFDIVLLDEKYLRLEAIIWAACGKDEGYNPQMMLEMMSRFARVSAGELETLQAPISPIELKRRWIDISDRAMREIKSRTREDYGFLLLDQTGHPRWHGEAENLRPHYASVGGAVPLPADGLTLTAGEL
ncbi:MAG: nucleotidyl transferase AbiEii/AbiGii toxin family protein [Verrucomicrobiales bacterium]|jgi:hypothetical protein|nr:nucleotidyl transferase AbiEii/AbiGii toxin family protein [Verrucomicrobiales bacterium]